MKNMIKSTILALALLGLVANAQTNTNVLTASVPSGKQAGGYELTLGGGGTEINGASEFGLDVSISTNPFKKLPSVWVGLAQGVYWEPYFAGSTDLFADWSFNLYKETVYLNLGWSGGVVYDNQSTELWRTGPELTLQYYVGENAFVFSGVNYDFVKDGDDGFRYSFGIGLAF